MHLVRDVATGPGIVALWPAWNGRVRIEWLIYLIAIAAAATKATARRVETNV
jgi:hypothetical protein